MSLISEDDWYSHSKNNAFNVAFEFLSENSIDYFPVWGMSYSQAHKKLVCDCNYGLSCNRKGKHPLSRENWSVIAAENKITTSDEWQHEYGNANIAVCTGLVSKRQPNSYLVVIDIDDDDSTSLDFLDGNSLTPTFEYNTGGGGKHLWYWSDKPIACSVKKLASNVDVRGCGGYAIVPPSCHHTGNHYMVTDETMWLTPIASIPVWLQTKLIELGNGEIQQRSPKKQKVHNPSSLLETSPLARLTVANLRRRLLLGTKIPDGMRNNTLLRLLGSDRATRGLDYAQLLENARYYRDNWCEDPSTIPNQQLHELATKVASYAKGFASQDHSMVNVNYMAWMQAKFNRSLNKNISLDRLEALDSKFFDKMLCVVKPCGTTRLGTPAYDQLMTLAEIAKSRESFMYMSGLGTFSKYRPQFLAKKLEELGAIRVRTSSGNYWNVGTTLAYERILSSANKMVTMNERLTDSFPCASLGNRIKPEPAVAFGSHFTTTSSLLTKTHMTIKNNTKTEIKFSRKNHPSEGRYVGYSCYETLNAVHQALEVLDSEQFTKMHEGTLIYDEDSTAEFFDEIQENDIVGLVLHEDGTGWIPRQYKVLKTKVNGLDQHLLQNRYGEEKAEQVVDFEQFSIALLLGYAEILKRDDKPYGFTDEELETKIVIEDNRSQGKDLDEAIADVQAPLEGDATTTETTETGEPVEEVIKEVLGKMEQDLVDAGFTDVDNGDLEEEEDDEHEDNGCLVPASRIAPSPLNGTKVWMLYFGTESGSREDCSIFYVTPEIYTNRADAVARAVQLSQANTGDPSFYTDIQENTIV